MDLRCNPSVLGGWDMLWLAVLCVAVTLIVIYVRGSSQPSTVLAGVASFAVVFFGILGLWWFIVTSASRDVVRERTLLIRVASDRLATMPNVSREPCGTLLSIKVHSIRHRTHDTRNQEGGGTLSQARQVSAKIETHDGMRWFPIIRLHLLFGLRGRVVVLDEFARLCGVSIEYSVEEHEHDEAEHR